MNSVAGLSADLSQVFRIVRPGIPVPIVLDDVPDVSHARERELESLGATPTYIGQILPIIGADADESAVTRIIDAELAGRVVYDTPTYISQEGATVAQSPFRSDPEEIRRRLEQRLDRTRVGATAPGSHLRTYLGAVGPLSIPHGSAVWTYEDVRVFTRSKDIYRAGATGRGVKVAVLDTGIAADHPMLEGQVVKQLSTVPEEAGTDGHGHGTHVAGGIAGKPHEYHGKFVERNGSLMQGLADGCKLIDVKVLTSEGVGSISSLISGIEAAVLEGANVINMSLGGLFGGFGDSPDAKAVDAAAERGVLCAVAAGNSFSFGSIGSPATAKGAISVGSVAMKYPFPRATSTFSSKGPQLNGRFAPTIAAPGGQLMPGGNEAILSASSGISLLESGDATHSLMRGSSQATPVIAGILAQAIPLGMPRDREMVELLLAHSTETRFPLKNNRTGWGTLDAVKLVQSIQNRERLSLRRFTAAQARFKSRVLGLAGGLVGGPRTPTHADILRLTLT